MTMGKSTRTPKNGNLYESVSCSTFVVAITNRELLPPRIALRLLVNWGSEQTDS